MKRFSFFLADVVALNLALIATIAIRYQGEFNYQYQLHLTPFSVVFMAWLVIFYITNLYDQQSWRNSVTFYSNMWQAMISATLLSVVFFYFIPFFGITPKTNLFLFIVLFAIIELALRSLFNRIVSTYFARRTLIVGVTTQTLELVQYLKDNPQIGYRLVALADLGTTLFDARHTTNPEITVVRNVDALPDFIRHQHIETVVISPEGYQLPQLIDMLYRLLEQRVTFYNLATFYERVTGKVPLGAINQIWFLENFSEENRGWYALAKRVLDIACAAILSVLLLPLYPFIALAIKLESKGPVFYRQFRMGKGSKPFTLIKFRNMVANDPMGGAESSSGPVWAAENDQRATRVGKYLRRSRIDELPQLWNVLKGEMSFVGPRPERPEFHDKLKDQIPFYEERYLVTPGLTGWAQIKHKLDFRVGMTVEDTAEKLQHDLYYIKNRSLLLDLGILLRTINILLQRVLS